jgi:hypothetical protein
MLDFPGYTAHGQCRVDNWQNFQLLVAASQVGLFKFNSCQRQLPLGGCQSAILQAIGVSPMLVVMLMFVSTGGVPRE